MTKRRKRTSKWARASKVGGIVGVFLLAAYFGLTSGWFVRSVVLPRVGKALGCELTAQDVSVSLFSSVRAKGVRLVPAGGDALVELAGLEVRYGLIPIVLGTVQVDRLALDQPVVTIVARKGAPSNLDQWLAGMPKSSGGGSGGTPKLAIRDVVVKGGSLRYDVEEATGRRTQLGVGKLEVALDQWMPPNPGRLKVSATLDMEKGPGAGAGKATGKFEGDVLVSLGESQQLRDLGCVLRFEVPEASGAMERFRGLGATLDVGLGPKFLTNAVMRFSQKGKPFGEVSLKGRMSLEESEMRLAYEVKGVDSRVLGLVGEASGLDLGDAVVSASGRLDRLNGGTTMASDGRLGISGLSIGTSRGRSRPVEVSLQHRLSVNDQTRSLVIEQLDLGVSRAGRAVVTGTLDNGLNISWNKSAAGFREATYTIKVAGLDLKDWAGLLPVEALEGMADMNFKVTVDDAGRTCNWSANADVRGIALGAGGRRYRGLEVRTGLQGRFRDFEQVNVDVMDAVVKADGTQVLTASGVADWRLSGGNGGAQIDVNAPIPGILALHPVEGVRLQKGTLKAVISGGIRASGPVGDVALQLNDLTGEVAGFKLESYDTSFSAGFSQAGKTVEMRSLSLTGQTGTVPGGSLEALGRYDMEKRTGFLDAKLIGANRSMLEPFLAPSLAPNRLAKVRLDIGTKVKVNLDGESSVSGSIKLDDLVVQHPQGLIPEVPFGLKLDFDGSHAGGTTDVRRLALAMEPTERASNQVQVAGRLHLGTASAVPSRLAITSTVLDFTPLYNLLGSATNAVKPAPSTGEPQPVHLPVRDLVADINIPRVYLREIDVGGLAGKVQIKDDVVSLEGWGLRFNEAGVKAAARVDLRRPGYEYAFSLSSEPIPLKPVVNTFLPVMKGMAQGAFTASADIRGAGTTGASLRRSLAGHVGFSATNAEVLIPERPIEVPALFSKYIPILPEKLDPALILRAIGKSDVIAEPFRVLEARAEVAQGTVKITQARALSAAMAVQVGGEIRIADSLDQSALDLPVQLAFGSKGSLPVARTIGKAVGTFAKPSFQPDVLGMGAVIGSLTVPGVGNVGAKAGEALKAAGAGLNQATGNSLGKAGAVLDAVSGKDGKGGANPIGGLLQGVLGAGSKPAANPVPTNSAPKGATPEALPGVKGKK